MTKFGRVFIQTVEFSGILLAGFLFVFIVYSAIPENTVGPLPKDILGLLLAQAVGLGTMHWGNRYRLWDSRVTNDVDH